MAETFVASAASPGFSWHGRIALRKISLLPLATFVLAGMLFAYIQFASPSIVDYDGYYHIKLSWLMRFEGIPTPFPWLPFTVINDKAYADQHTLFHVLQVPFTFIPDLVLAAKVSAVFYAALAMAFFAWILAKYEVPNPLVWIAVLIGSSAPFLYRMSMPRAPSVSLIFQLLCFHYLAQRRILPLWIASTLFVLAYNGFPTLLMLTGAWLFVILLTERRIEYRLLLAVLAGIAVGLLINPYVPRNILFLYDHIVPKIFATQYATNVGSEWYPYNSWGMLTLNALAIIAYVGGIFVTNREEWLSDKVRLFSFLVATAYFFLLFKSRRFVEYFPPFAVLFLALSVRGALARWLPADWIRLKRVALPVMGFFVLGAFALSVSHVHNDVRQEPDSLAYRGGARWLAENTPANSIVFHTDWDDFPMLFFYNTHNRYIVGLDADNLRLKDEPLFRLWESITLGRIEDPADEIIQKFQSHYVFTDRHHEEFISIADSSSRFRRKYIDDNTIVYRVD